MGGGVHRSAFSVQHSVLRVQGAGLGVNSLETASLLDVAVQDVLGMQISQGLARLAEELPDQVLRHVLLVLFEGFSTGVPRS